MLASTSSCVVRGELREGAQSVAVRNVGERVAYVYVAGVGEQQAMVFGDVENLGPGSEAEMPVAVGAGRYQVWCSTGLSGNGHAADVVVRPGAAPVSIVPAAFSTTVDDFVEPFQHYRSFVADELRALAGPLAQVHGALTANDAPAARAAYLLAHGRYGRLGAAYGAFGDLGDAIDGVDASTGFHRVEALLWATTPDLAAAVAVVDRLAVDVAALAAAVDALELDPVNYTVRAHEILEDALHDAATGVAEPYSHSGVDDIAAAAEGTRVVLGTLQALVKRADAALWTRIEAGLDRLDRALASLATGTGAHVRDDELTRPQRAALTAALGAALEELARVPGLIQPSGSS